MTYYNVKNIKNGALMLGCSVPDKATADLWKNWYEVRYGKGKFQVCETDKEYADWFPRELDGGRNVGDSRH